MKLGLFLKMGMLSISLCTHVLSAPNAKEIVSRIISQPASKCDLSEINSSNHLDVVVELRKMLDKKHGDYVGARLVLLRIGDTTTIHELSAQFQAYDSDAAWTEVLYYVERAKQPLLAVEFAKELNNDPKQKKSGMIGGGPTSVGVLVPPEPNYAGALILATIINSDRFNVELRHWAREEYGRQFEPPFLTMMRLWWKQNRDVLEAGMYDQVKVYQPEPQPTVGNPQFSSSVTPYPAALATTATSPISKPATKSHAVEDVQMDPIRPAVISS